METPNKRNSDLQALYAILDEITEIEQIDKRLESIHAELSLQKKSLSVHNIFPVQTNKNVNHVNALHYRAHKRKYIWVCCISVILYLCFSITVGIFAWMQLKDEILTLQDGLTKMIYFELLLAVVTTICSIICCTRELD